jgi:5-methylthioadenosine/S-adenosylhomocysteine deaminase
MPRRPDAAGVFTAGCLGRTSAMAIRSTAMRVVFVAVAMVALAVGPTAQIERHVSLVVTGGIVITQDERRTVLSPGAVAIDGPEIVAVDRADAIAAKYRADETIRALNQIVLPGLVNTHTHAPMVLYRGLADDLALMDWLQKYIFPAEARTVSPEFVRIGTRLAALEMIESGTTTYADMYYFEEEIAKATRAAGLRGVLGQTVIQFPSPDAKTPVEAVARAERFIAAFKNDSLITPAVAPHAVFTNDTASLLACAALARRAGVPILIHLAETEDEVRQSRAQHQMTPAAFLDSIGFWSPRTLAAHGVWVTPDDMAILKRHAVGVAHNPESNMKLASGAAPVAQYLAAGIPVGLGTDGAASNNDLDMFEAMRQASLLAKHTTRDPTAVPARTALEMATIGGAKALAMDRWIGSVEAGKRADLITVSTASARQTPMYDPVSHLVYVTRGDDVRTTIVNGKVLMKERQLRTLDRATVIADANRLAREIRGLRF